MSDSTYQFSLVRKVLDKYSLGCFTYKPLIHPRSIPIHYDSCRIFFPNSDIIISLQTDPSITGASFCETALMSPKGVVKIRELGYSDCLRHDTPEDLDIHLFDLICAVKGKNLADFNALQDEDS